MLMYLTILPMTTTAKPLFLGKTTDMEHDWDEAYGYLYGTATNLADPNPTVGGDDSFLNKYLGKVNTDTDFSGIADDICNALKLGRAAIVAKDYICEILKLISSDKKYLRWW